MSFSTTTQAVFFAYKLWGRWPFQNSAPPPWTSIIAVTTGDKYNIVPISVHTMNLSFLAWLKFQPLHGLYGSVGNHACKAISQTSALTPGYEKQQTVSNWAFQYIEQATSRLASHLTVVSSSLREGCRASGYNWLLAPMITRMQDASMSMHSINIKPSLTIAECEHIKESRSPSRVPARASPL